MASTRNRLSKTQKQRRERDDNRMGEILNQRFAMQTLKPKTAKQEDLFDSYYSGKKVIANIGSAGTGKTFVSLFLALKDVMNSSTVYDKIIVVRSAVQTRDQGFMPGTLQEKEAYYEGPYVDALTELFGRGDAYQVMKAKKTINFMSSSFVRGLTWDKAIIIVDECQSMTLHELESIITRLGENSRVIFCGDTRQDDLATKKNRLDVSGLSSFLKVVRKMDSSDVIEFTTDDIVRSGVVREYLVAKEQMEEFA